MKKFDYIFILLHIPVTLTAGYALYLYKHLIKELKVFSIFLFLSCIIQLSAMVLSILKTNNMPLLHVYVAFGFLSLAWFYVYLLDGFINKNIIWIVTGLFLLYNGINSIFIQPLTTFNSNTLTLESILVIILALSTYMLFLNDVVRNQKKQLVTSISWINSGLFIYYSSNVLIFYFGSLFTHVFSTTLTSYTWLFHSFFMVVMYLCFFIGLWKRPRK